ncbi:MAG: S41 family peptidase [Terriglobia bacterium]
MKQAPRWLWFILSTVLLCTLLGGLYGRQVEATKAGDDSDVESSLTKFTRVYNVVEQNYADGVDPDKAIYGPSETNVGAIPGALRTLDPHSNFYDPMAFSRLREDQEGKYYGVGMQIGQRPGKLGKLVVVVMSPIPGSPAFRAGLRPGDVIAKVNGLSTEGMNTQQVAEKLKGPKGTQVHITVAREGYDQPLEFDITRDEISQRSVDDVFLIKPGIAYIHINRFNENTNDELTEALKSLDEKSLQGLVLDLRGNPGGLLQEAVEVSDHFLEKSQLIVYHYGRHSQEKRYYTTKGDSGKEYPIVVLINRMTASAAEIVTGALQDHDRALVMGEPSFGKGLVQTVFPLSERTGLALTTARYYTPSGRLIQRDYNNVSLYDYYYHPEESPTPHTDVRLTDGGREVYGGGGITPDVKYGDPKLTPTEEALVQHGAFSEFGLHYLGIHKTIPNDFQVTDDVLQEFRQFLAEQKIQISDQDLKNDSDFIRTRIHLQLVNSIFGETESNRIAIGNDPLVQKAVASMPQASELLAKAKRYIASKTQR